MRPDTRARLGSTRPLRLIVVTALLLVASAGSEAASSDTDLATHEYLQRLDLARMRQLGMDFSNPRYSPLRLKKPLNKIDVVYDYDFPLLERTFRALRGVDRGQALGKIFGRVTRGAGTGTEKHLAVLRFLQEASYHNAWIQPMHPDRQAVFDPLVLLELNEMRCGQVSRVAVDLFEAAGYRGRVAQVGGHVLAEVYYDGDWHYFDGDVFDAGGVIRDADGSIPSIAELSRHPERLDRAAHYIGFNPQTAVWAARPGRPARSSPYPSSYYFGRKAYGSLRPAFYVKSATAAAAQASRFYGWNWWTTVPNTAIKLADMPIRSQPGAPLWRSVKVQRRDDGRVTVDLAWRRAVDRDGDVVEYRVFVGRRSRGWQLDRLVSDRSVAAYVRGLGWRPAEYSALGRPLPADVGRFRTPGTQLRIALPRGGTYYVSVTAADRYGISIGKRIFFASEELTIRA